MKVDEILKILIVMGLAMCAQAPLAAQNRPTPEQIRQFNKEKKAKEKAAAEAAEAAEATDVMEQPAVPTFAPGQPLIPLSAPPQNLKNERGENELDLVDPFQRSAANSGTEKEEEVGLSATSQGEISEDFSILAIMIPENESREPVALIRLQEESNPQVVRKGELVQISRRVPSRRAVPRPRRGEETSFEQSAFNALETFTYYLQIKEIHPTYIEAFQKKSPNESIILR